MTTQPRRSQVPDDLRDIYKRVRILEALNRNVSSGGGFATYAACVLADPTTVNFWMMNDLSGNLADSVGSDDLAVTSFVKSSITWPQYSKVGPFVAVPEQTAVENGGGDFTAANASQSRFTGPTIPAGTTPFTLQGWINLLDIDYGGLVVDGGVRAFINVAFTTGAITAARGGVTLTGGVAVENVWTHVRLDYNGTTARLFQDFVLVDSDASGSVVAGTLFTFLNVEAPALAYSPFVGRAAMWSLHDGIADTCQPEGSGGGSDNLLYTVMSADGAGGIITPWPYPTIEVTY